MEKHYTLRKESEAISSAQLIYDKYKVPTIVMKIVLPTDKNYSYTVIPNSHAFFEKSENLDGFDKELHLKYAFDKSSIIFMLP